ncbi:MAG: MmcQ/YjbR family DNA-binding protein [Chitinophagales bacterium]
MNIEDIREYCLAKSAVSEDFPFDEETLTFKVLDKIFLIISLDSIELSINLKCDPDKAIDLRENHACVKPGYHMNKKHWNTVDINGELSDRLIYELIDHSYDLVVKGLPKSKQAEL